VRRTAHAAPPDAWVEEVPAVTAGAVATSYLRCVGAMAAAEFHRVRHVPTIILTRVAQPLLWLLVFGAALSQVRDLPTDGVSYQTFIVPGVLAQSVLFIAIFSGLAIVWERDLGITQKILAAPVSRSAVILGKALGAGIRALVQVVVVLAIIGVIGIPLRWSPFNVVGALAACVLGAMLFASVSMIIASLVRTREQFMGLGQLITLPLFFASNALYAVSLMPTWLQTVAYVNPLTYQVEILRHLLVGVGPGRIFLSTCVLVGVTAAAVAVASVTYPRRAV
jgi:ABC-2 type transport system permease protein